MKLYLIRGIKVVQLKVDPRVPRIPHEPLLSADFAFEIEHDGTVTFHKKRSPGSNKNFFTIELALKHIQRYYEELFLEIDLSSFEICDLTKYDGPQDYKEKVGRLVKSLREGI